MISVLPLNLIGTDRIISFRDKIIHLFFNIDILCMNFLIVSKKTGSMMFRAFKYFRLQSCYVRRYKVYAGF